MAKNWAEWETSLKQGAKPTELLGLPTKNPDAEPSKISPNLTVQFEGEEFKFCMSRVPPPSLNQDVGYDVLVTKPSIPFNELFPPLLIDPQPEMYNQEQVK